MRREDGLALLAVAAATAALAALVAVVSLAAAGGAAAAGYRAQRKQAEWLAESVVRQTVRAFEARALAPPVQASRVICDGIDTASATVLPIGVFPETVPGWSRPLGGDAPHRVCVELAVVRGPSGEVRGVTAANDGTILVDASVRARHGHARVQRTARLVVHPTGTYRLH